MPAKTKRNSIKFPNAIRSFVGYLEGTNKASHTIKSYKLDISAFHRFLETQYPGKSAQLERVSRGDLELYRDTLKESGLKANTRRRKILTVTQFLSFLSKRKKLGPEMAQKLATPHKIERIPFTVSSDRLLESIRLLPETTILDLRNKILLWTLCETGCLVSEVSLLSFENWSGAQGSLTASAATGAVDQAEIQASVFIEGKAARRVPVSQDLFEGVGRLKGRSGRKFIGAAQERTQERTKEGVQEGTQDQTQERKGREWIFYGFNRFGSLGSPISARGVELLVKLYGPKLGVVELTPKTFRQSVVLKWFEKNYSQAQIQKWLGLKTPYAFRAYEALLSKSNSGTTSNPETIQTES